MLATIEFLVVSCFVVSGFLGLFAVLLDDNKKSKLYGSLLLLLSASLLTLMIYTTIGFDETSWKREDPYVTHMVMALQDGNEVAGSLSGGRYSMSGYIGEEFMYVYGYRVAGGGMKIQKVNANNATVYFNDEVSPHANWYCETKRFLYREEKRYTCDIFIPTGSLQAEIVLDLK